MSDSSMKNRKVFDIVGGGSAGIATASSLLRRRPSLSIAVVEPFFGESTLPGSGARAGSGRSRSSRAIR